MPDSSVHFSVRWWWKLPSALEVQLLCRLAVNTGEKDTSTRWREHLVPALVGNDVSLAEHLWDALHLDLQGLRERLLSFAQERRWTVDTLQAWGAPDFLKETTGKRNLGASGPPVRWRALWAQGALSWTPEYGLELHTAALAVLGQHEALRHRLWRGQAALLLPLIDSIRLELCEHLSRQYGADWPVRWHQPMSEEDRVAVKATALACQWGYLKWLLINCSALHREQRWLPLVTHIHCVRNALAHYQPVSLMDFEGIWQEFTKFTEH